MNKDDNKNIKTNKKNADIKIIDIENKVDKLAKSEDNNVINLVNLEESIINTDKKGKIFIIY